MTENKRFTFDEDVNEDDMYEMGVFSDNGKVMETIDVLNCLNNLHEENEQLKKDVDYWKQVASQYSNELNVLEHSKKYKTKSNNIYWSSDVE